MENLFDFSELSDVINKVFKQYQENLDDAKTNKESKPKVKTEIKSETKDVSTTIEDDELSGSLESMFDTVFKSLANALKSDIVFNTSTYDSEGNCTGGTSGKIQPDKDNTCHNCPNCWDCTCCEDDDYGCGFGYDCDDCDCGGECKCKADTPDSTVEVKTVKPQVTVDKNIASALKEQYIKEIKEEELEREHQKKLVENLNARLKRADDNFVNAVRVILKDREQYKYIQDGCGIKFKVNVKGEDAEFVGIVGFLHDLESLIETIFGFGDVYIKVTYNNFDNVKTLKDYYATCEIEAFFE